MLNASKQYGASKELFASLGIVVVALLNDPKSSLRAKDQESFFKAAPVCLVCDFCFIFTPVMVITMNQKSSLRKSR